MLNNEVAGWSISSEAREVITLKLSSHSVVGPDRFLYNSIWICADSGVHLQSLRVLQDLTNCCFLNFVTDRLWYSVTIY
jgi:hypothetical protein